MLARALVLLAVFAGCGPSVADGPRAPAPVEASEAPGDVPTAAGNQAAPKASRAPSAFAPLLKAHNRYRARHCAPPLAWSPKLARVAKSWAQKLRARGCPLEHSRHRYGENLAAATTGALSPEGVTDLWYREVERYDFGDPGFSFEAGHFTQLVWESTREIGCAQASCSGIELWVCNYAPAGNVHGRFDENVHPASCRR